MISLIHSPLSSAEEPEMSDLLSQIAKLKSSISGGSTASNTSNHTNTKTYHKKPYQVRKPLPGRNKTLIINNNAPQGYVSVQSAGTKKLVNKELYKQELESAQETLDRKQRALAQRKEAARVRGATLRASKNRVKLDYCDRCIVGGDLFAIARYGSKLVPLDPVLQVKPSPVEWNGKRYTRTKSGTLKLMNQKIHLVEQCRYFQKEGFCTRQSTCKYAHNKDKIALCPWFFRDNGCRGTRPDGTACTYSHSPNEFNSPHCRFFIRGSCRNPECPYVHTKPELNLICRPFSIGGYCPRGKGCQFQHLFDCPDWQLEKKCPRGKNCRLRHVQGVDNLDAKLTFSTLDPAFFQLPDLQAKVEDIHSDPRIIATDVIEDHSQHYLEDSSDEESSEDDFEGPGSDEEELEIDADFIQF